MTQAPPSSSRVAAPSPCRWPATSSPHGLIPLPTRPPTDLWIWAASASPPRPSPLGLTAARCCLGSRRRAPLVARRRRALVPLPSHHCRNWSRRGADPADGGHHALHAEPPAARLGGICDAEQRAEVPAAGHGAAGAAARRSERRADRRSPTPQDRDGGARRRRLITVVLFQPWVRRRLTSTSWSHSNIGFSNRSVHVQALGTPTCRTMCTQGWQVVASRACLIREWNEVHCTVGTVADVPLFYCTFCSFLRYSYVRKCIPEMTYCVM